MSLSYGTEMDLQSRGTLRQAGSEEPEVRPWTVLRGETRDYQLRRLRFNGCFSKVPESKEVGTGDYVVIKIVKKRAAFSLEPNRELNPENRFGWKTRFVGVLRQMLRLNPQERMTPSAALCHPFVTLTELGTEEVVASAAAESGTSGAREGGAVGRNVASVGGACSDEAGVTSAMSDLPAGSEASGNSSDETLNGYATTGEGIPPPAAGDTDAAAGSTYNDGGDNAAATVARARASTCPEANDLCDAASTDDEASASLVTESDEGGVYSSAEAQIGSDGVIGFFVWVFKSLRRCWCCCFWCCGCVCTTNVQQ